MAKTRWWGWLGLGMILTVGLLVLAAILAVGSFDDTEPVANVTPFGEPTTTAASRTYPMGAKVTYENGVSVQLFVYEQPVAGQPFTTPDPGMELSAADVEFCASPTAEVAYNVLGFYAQTADNRRYQKLGSTRNPGLSAGTLPAGGGCKRGWVTLEAPIGVKPVAVVFSYYGLREVKWSI